MVGATCRKGHPRTPENAFLRPTGYFGCKVCQKAQKIRHHLANPSYQQQRSKKWYANRTSAQILLSKQSRKKSYDKYKSILPGRNRARGQELKRIIMEGYGGKCVCCKISDLIFLTIDHIAGDGKKDRINSRNPYTLYRRLCKLNFPSGFQVLCFNCNFAKHNGGCPHNIKGVI